MSVSKIEIETVTENCWKECDEFEVAVEKYFANGEPFLKILRCVHVKRCYRIKDTLLDKERRNHERK